MPKKLLLAALAAVGGLLAYRKVQADRARRRPAPRGRSSTGRAPPLQGGG